MCTGDVLEIDCALDGIHPVMVKVDPEFQIGDREIPRAKMAIEMVAFRGCEYRPGAFFRIMYLGRRPGREKECIVIADVTESRRSINVNILFAHEICVEEAAWHFAFQKNVMVARRNDKL